MASFCPPGSGSGFRVRFGSGSGPTDLIDSGSETLVSTVPVPVPVPHHWLYIKMCRVILGSSDVDAPVSRYGRATKRCATCLSNAPSYKEGSCLKKVTQRERVLLIWRNLSAFLMYHTITLFWTFSVNHLSLPFLKSCKAPCVWV